MVVYIFPGVQHLAQLCPHQGAKKFLFYSDGSLRCFYGEARGEKELHVHEKGLTV